MATLRCYPGAPGPILPEDDHGECTVTYTVTQGSAAYRYVVTQLSVKNLYSVTRSFPYTVKLGQTTYANGTVSNVAAGGTKTVMLDVDGRVSRGSSTQAGLTITASVSGVSNSSDSNSTTVPPVEYSVTYDANGGSGAPPAQAKTYGQTLTLSSVIPTRADYSFWHWNTSSTNSGTSYNSGASYTANASVTLYAIWNPKVYYNANGGSGAPATQTKTYGQTLTLSSTVPTRNGYRFNGWNTAANGTGTNYSAGASYTSNSPVTLYAKWQKESNPPTISSMSVIRVDSNGNQDDEGVYGKVTVTWSVDLTSETIGNANRGTLRGSYVASSDTSQERSLSWSGTWRNATGGTATATFPASLDEQYLVLVTLTDNRQSVSKADILTRAEFVMDFKKGGKAIGIFSAAPDDGLLIGRDTRIDGQLSVNGIERTFVNIPQESIVTSKGLFRAYKNNVVCTVVGSNIKLDSWTYSGSKKIGTLPEGYTPPVYMTTAVFMRNATASTAGRYFVEVYESGEIYLRAQADGASLSTYAAASFTITWAM